MVVPVDPRAAVAHAQGRSHERHVDAGLSRSNRALERFPQRRDRGQSRREIDRAATRPRAQARTRARPAARNPRAREGQHRDGRRDGDHRRIARARRKPRACRRSDRAPVACRRRGDPRQGEPVGMGQLPRLRAVQRLVGARRFHARSLSAQRRSVRLELGVGRRGGGRAVQRRRGHRDRRVGRVPVGQQRDRRPQTDARCAVGRRHHPDCSQPGHCRTDGPPRRRRRDPARCDARTYRPAQSTSVVGG